MPTKRSVLRESLGVVLLSACVTLLFACENDPSHRSGHDFGAGDGAPKEDVRGRDSAKGDTDVGDLAAPAPTTFRSLGIGGGGGIFNGSISPHDPKLMLISSDMSGVYRSTDGGESWQMVPFRQIKSVHRGASPAYTASRIFWNSGATLHVSADKGASWTKASKGGWSKDIERLTAITAGGKDIVFVGTSEGVFRKEWPSGSWTKVLAQQSVEVLSLGNKLYTFHGGGSFAVSADGGLTWASSKPAPFASATVASLTGALEGAKVTLLASAPGVGVARSRDEGKTWQVVDASYDDKSTLQMAAGQSQVIYAAQQGASSAKKVFCSKDGGDSWNSCFDMASNVTPAWVQTELKWGYYITDNGFFASRSDPQVALLSTQGDLYITRDGGQSWSAAINREVSPKTYASIGLEVTSCWDYLISPWDPKVHFIAYTDIGFARSEDGGESWSSAVQGSPYKNTFYAVAFDESVQGRMYAAVSSRHDIPHWTHISPNSASHKGTVVVSDDHGKSWRKLGSGLPDLPVTDLLVEGNTLFAAVFGAGVYISKDGGQSWQASDNRQGGDLRNKHTLRVARHPKTKALYQLVTAHREGSSFPYPGGLYRSSDEGASWTYITPQDFEWPTSFALHPDDGDTIFVTVATAPGSSKGGLWKSSDGGTTWARILADSEYQSAAGAPGYDHTMVVTLHPKDPQAIYVSTVSHGLWFSRDGGSTFALHEAFPHKAPHAVVLDPSDSRAIYVTSFGGGVFRGPAFPAAGP